MEFPVLFLKTILLRPYVFVFLGAFLVSGFWTMGRRRTLVFLFITWFFAFFSEFLSTRIGFPFGLYHYTGATKGQELYIFNVPFMDSLSFTFLLFASFSMALFSLAPLRIQKGNVQIADTFRLRQSFPVLLLTVIYMTMVDVVIDPVALQGEKWFLGRIYYYEEHGHYFGVPVSNALGWAFVGFSALFVYQRIERKWLGARFRDRGLRWVWGRGLLGVGLYYGVLIFILSIAAWIGDRFLLIAGCFLYVMPTAFLLLRMFDTRSRATEEDWRAHLQDFQISFGPDD